LSKIKITSNKELTPGRSAIAKLLTFLQHLRLRAIWPTEKYDRDPHENLKPKFVFCSGLELRPAERMLVGVMALSIITKGNRAASCVTWRRVDDI